MNIEERKPVAVGLENELRTKEVEKTPKGTDT